MSDTRTAKRIGIIGTENSHAMAFARYFNDPAATGKAGHTDWRVSLVHGEDPATADAIVEALPGIARVERIEDMLGAVDAVMVTNRAGSKHAAAARPFIECGMPVFIDKPLTADYAEARELLALAEAKGSLVNSGSGLKYAWDIQLLANEAARLRGDGALLGATLSFAADLESPYDGFYFYSPHLVEMALTVLGGDIESVQATRSEQGVGVLLRYPDIVASLLFTRGSAQGSGLLVGTREIVTRPIDLSMIYAEEARHFVALLDHGVMAQGYAEQLRPVAVIDAILRALESGGTEQLPRD